MGITFVQVPTRRSSARVAGVCDGKFSRLAAKIGGLVEADGEEEVAVFAIVVALLSFGAGAVAGGDGSAFIGIAALGWGDGEGDAVGVLTEPVMLAVLVGLDLGAA